MFECIIDRMKNAGWSGWGWLALAVAAAVLGFQAWQASRNVSVVIAWETASELDTAGFNLYRGAQADGPYQQINDVLIPGSPDPITGGSYEFVDSDVEAGKTYYYQLEEVEQSGVAVLVETTAVQASGGGRLELALAGVLFLLSLAGLARQARPGQAQAQQEG